MFYYRGDSKCPNGHDVTINIPATVEYSDSVFNAEYDKLEAPNPGRDMQCDVESTYIAEEDYHCEECGQDYNFDPEEHKDVAIVSDDEEEKDGYYDDIPCEYESDLDPDTAKAIDSSSDPDDDNDDEEEDDYFDGSPYESEFEFDLDPDTAKAIDSSSDPDDEEDKGRY